MHPPGSLCLISCQPSSRMAHFTGVTCSHYLPEQLDARIQNNA